MGTLDEVMEHFGVKGMHWGVSKSGPTSSDAQNAKGHRAVVKKSGTQALSNKDLQELVTRMNLEQQYSKLSHKPSRIAAGYKAVKVIVGVGKTANEIATFSQSATGKMLATKLKEHSAKA